MPAVLVTVEDLESHLGLEAGTDAELLQTLADAGEAMFLAACGRSRRPFLAAAASRTELHDGTGTGALWLDYPVGDASTITLTVGTDHTDPDETLDVDDLVIAVGSREVRRLEACSTGTGFGALDRPGRVRVTYTAQAEAPADAALAITRVCAALYWQRGAEGTRSERAGAISTDYAAIAESDPVWRAAVDAHREVHV